MKKLFLFLLGFFMSLCSFAQSTDSVYFYVNTYGENDPSQANIFHDYLYISDMQRGSLPTFLIPGHYYTVRLYNDDTKELLYEFCAQYTCNLNNPEEMELFGVDRGTIESPDMMFGIYNIVCDETYEGEYPPGWTGDWTDEDYLYADVVSGFHIITNGVDWADYTQVVFLEGCHLH